MAVNHLNEIISLFLQWNVKELSDNDLSTGISNNGKTCSAEEVRHTARLLGSSLFQFRYNEDNVFLIRIAPTINICKDFLAGKCTFKAEGCNQLHLCRRFGSCNTKNCHFPHDFTHGNNRRIVEQSNCQNVNPILLVRLIRLNKQLSRRLSNTSVIPRVISKTPNTTSSSVEPKQVQQVFKRNKHFRSRRKSRGDKSNTVTDGDNTTESTVVSSVLDTNCQINISFPSKSITSHITIDEIVDFLRLQGVAIQKVFNAKKNERFHQCTLQFQEQNGKVLPKFVIPSPLLNSVTTDDRPIVSDDITHKIVTLTFNNSAQVALFTDKTFQNCLQTYFNKNYCAKLDMEDSADVNSRSLQQVSPLAILVHYIDKEHIEFGVDEQIIDGLCRKTLVLAKCTSATFEKEWESLKMKIYIRDDYGKDICLFDEQQTITLFGLPEVVKNVQQLFEDKKPKYIPPIVKNELNKPETSVQPSQSTIHQEDKQIKKQIVQTFSIAFDVDEPGFEILANRDCNQLLNIVGSKCQLEKQIIYHKIQIQIPKVRADHFNYNTLQSQSQENTSESTNDVNNPSANSNLNWFQRLFQRSKSKTQSSTPVKQQNSTPQVQATSSATNITSIAIGNSKIIVCTGDLTKQAVDIIVVCSTSGILRDAIISAAGQQVKTVYNQQPSNSILEFETTGGNLPCKKIVFRPWICNKNQTQNLKPSIITFVQSVISFALHHKLTTIAFPSIGCGQLGFDPKLIAEYMIGETYEQFKNTVHSTLIVSFVLLPGQKNVYDAFTDRLNKIQMIDDKPTSISFDKQIVRIKLTGSNNSQLIEYRNTIKQLAQSCSLKLHLTDKTDMTDWSQDTIQRYYDYCLHRQVIPKLDLQNSTLDLIGPKDAVTDAEKYFFQLTAEILRNARIQVLTRGCIWSVEISSGQWEQYPFRINELIENAQLKKLPYIEFENEKSEKCRIIFSSMEEECQKRKRKVCRKRIDSTLPQYWDLSGDYFKRVVLLDSSNEYKDVLNRFDSTMKGNYSKIMKIERIQNERWYKQYAAHRDEFTQRYTQPDERLLFHGCSSESADKIVQECFNRAFAGANGVMYGQGVYFHEHSKYSHSYAKASTSNERTMFLARVLIGKTCLGNSSMKVPPKSFDTTTDGGYIFVIYHDAGAYGEYLITYR
ncbi:unnamed protein product [Rotaria sp. Silwood1]|nr:unnamed protein product [Rotaria sp. Silwood1]